MNKKCHFWRYALPFFIPGLPVSAVAAPFLATGSFFSETDQRPLLALNFDGHHWEYPLSLHQEPLPGNCQSGSSFTGSTCKASLCLAAGYYYDSDANHQPLLALSENRGLDWRYLSLPEQKGRFKSIACANQRCLAVGYYENDKAVEYPLLAIGKTDWNYANSAVNAALPADFQTGKFEDIVCTQAVCIVTGYYQNRDDSTQPLLLRSEDEGEHWQNPARQDPRDFVAGSFARVSCQGEFCITAGNYSDKTMQKPFISLSYDSGKHWQSPELPLAQDFISGSLADAQCAGKFCIAAGLYENTVTVLPLLFYSEDQGKHWFFSEYISHSGLPAGTEDGELRQTACGNDFCIAAGYYHDRVGAHPLIAVSDDKGKTWDYPESATTSVPGADVGDGEFVHASCRENTCVAVGNYLRDDRRFPLLAMSNDKGKTWEFSAPADEKQLPPGFISGEFEASSAGR